MPAIVEKLVLICFGIDRIILLYEAFLLILLIQESPTSEANMKVQLDKQTGNYTNSKKEIRRLIIECDIF